ncbi:MAG: SDR family NAD(P)-dependent oxidoreductase [Gammaproteobacteria bacterium]|tara:strand:- start:9447 stop:10214 length:768 start_codon:yes stop_codon:yes gene_type:complete
MSLFNLKNKSILITGSSRGIGKSIAHQCALHGANVIISSRKLDACEKTANEINNEVGNEVAFPIAANISDESQLDLLVESTRKQLGKIDVLICNAATNPFMGSMLDMPSEKFDKVMNNNIKSNQVLCNLVLPEMIDRNDGAIIIISSIAAIKGSPILGAYNISKAADVMIVKNIAAEFGNKNIRANSIAPGLIKTDFAKALWENPDILKAVLSTTPMQRIGEPNEIAGVAVMLASDAGNYINGQTIVVDGGTTIS